MPATAVTTAFHVPDLGLRVAFIGPQQSQSALGSMPGSVGHGGRKQRRPLRKPGSMSLISSKRIGGHKIETVDDLRKTIRKLGPGKTQFTIQRPNGRKTISVDCPNCKAG